jgi:hypothetical protein
MNTTRGKGNREVSVAAVFFRLGGLAAAAAYSVVCLLWLIRILKTGLASLLELGYGDSYILYDVLSFEKSGFIYHSSSSAPYLPALYSPFTYLMYSVSRYFSFANPFLAPRIIALATFVSCVAIALSLTKELIPVRLGWIAALLLILTSQSMYPWILQVRCDFAGICFALAAIRLLLSRRRLMPLLAGLCAGMAVQVKLTLIAAAVSGLLWLLMRRRWKDAGLFTLGAGITTIGLFFAYWLREPAMIRNMTALMPGIRHLPGDVMLMASALNEPICLLALPAVAFIVTHTWPLTRQWTRWTLVLLYASASFAVAFLADLQAGGNINYYFEGLFALSPFAVLGCLQLYTWSGRRPPLAAFLAGVLLVHVATPAIVDLYKRADQFSSATIARNNHQFELLEIALRNRSILSLDPRVALIDPRPVLTEAYLLTYLRTSRRFDLAPLNEAISDRSFDVFVSPIVPITWRGVRSFDAPEIERSVDRRYTPYCTILGDVIQLPRAGPADAELLDKLLTAGCVPVH